MLKSSLLFVAAMLFLAVCLTLAGRNPQPVAAAQSAATQNPVKATPESQAKAKEIYKRDCALCHGDNGSGKTDLASSMSLNLDDWTDAKTLAGKPDGGLFAIIRNGKDKMPSEDSGRANDTEVWNLIIYIRTLSKSQPAATAATPTGN